MIGLFCTNIGAVTQKYSRLLWEYRAFLHRGSRTPVSLGFNLSSLTGSKIEGYPRVLIYYVVFYVQQV